MKKSEFKDLLSIATTEWFFIFNKYILYKQIDGVAVGSPLWLPLDALWNIARPLYYRRCVDDILVLFKSSHLLNLFQSYLDYCPVSMSFTIEKEHKNKVSFLNVNVIREQGKFTSVYQNPTFIRVYTHFDSFYITPTKLIWYKE